jgi:phosphoglycerate dehydrogenase-like enzyme
MRCAIGPEESDPVADAVREGGGTVVGLDEQPEALIWMLPREPARLQAALDVAPSVQWVQLPFAGIEAFVDVLTPDRTWTCAKGVYSEPTAEHAMALALAGLRRLQTHARATSWGKQGATTLYDADVVVLGAGGITQALLALLAPYRANVTVVRRGSDPVPGAARTVPLDRLDDVLPDAVLVVLALALTPDTEHVVDARRLSLMRSDAWLVNVARGRHVDTAALVTALQDGTIGGAALDVTDPEPLPDDNPLWHLPNCLITPHTANPWQTAQPLLRRRITENVRRRAAAEPLLGVVDLDAGY